MKIKTYSALVLTSMLAQNFAMAYDLNRFQSLSPEGQHAQTLIRERISGMSENVKLKLSYQLYKVTLKILPSLGKISDSEFNTKLQARIANKNVNDSSSKTEVELDQKDLEAILPTDSSLQMSETSLQRVRSIHIRAGDVSQQANNIIESIGYKTDSKGNKKPLSRAEFNEKALSYGTKQNLKQASRMIAEIQWDEVLTTLLNIVIIGIAIGLIVMFGWMGVSIILGSLILAAIIWIINGLMHFGH